jgi:hypothetical protein
VIQTAIGSLSTIEAKVGLRGEDGEAVAEAGGFELDALGPKLGLGQSLKLFTTHKDTGYKSHVFTI